MADNQTTGSAVEIWQPAYRRDLKPMAGVVIEVVAPGAHPLAKVRHAATKKHQRFVVQTGNGAFIRTAGQMRVVAP